MLEGERVWRPPPATSEAKLDVPEHFDPRECILALKRAASAARLDRASEISAAAKQLAESESETRRWKARVMPSGSDVGEAGVTARAAHAWMIKCSRMQGSNLRSKWSASDYTIWAAVDDDDTEFYAAETDEPGAVAQLIEFAHDVTGIDQWRILAEMAGQS
jgi:hypothetical protein